ncbi:P-loop containing nucleoside triphosphate hydrolase protein [Dactylonectria macrodidyma]|uniref:P-loop containing nucleoside triphosphate hydrolase protein n=1 Tax=Dactylonectria macrodidyma TaxID=307937 RepID=A0A9P9FMV3_9HYPO|nr:P-loop containing nucleoside triphosphate hydrolase protein [Dactylonectria macrodidyma]
MMGDPLDKELKVPDVQAAAIQPTNLERSTDSDEERIEKTGEKDGDNISEVKDIDDEEDELKGSELKVTRTSASAATTATHATTPAPIPEKKSWHKKLNPLRWGPPPPVPTEKTVSREFKAGFFSLLTFQWMAPLMTNGYRRSLEENDIWTVNPSRAAGPLTAQLRESFKRRVARGDKYPLLWAMHETFKFGIWLGGICALFTNIIQVISPFTLRYLIQFASDAWESHMTGGPAPHIGRGVGLAIGITLMQVAQSLGTNHFIYQGMMVGGQFRGVLIGLIYEKSMVISGRAKAGVKSTMPPETESTEDKESGKGKQKQGKKGKPSPDTHDGAGWGNGRIVNLMSVDTYRIDQASALFHMTWTSPVLVLVTLALLLVNITYSALAGFGLLVVGMPFLTKAIRSLFHRRRDINKITDDRVSLTQEILQSVRFVKYFGWEKSFLERLSDYRSREIHAIQVLLAIRNALNAVSMSLPIFASMLSFIAYSLTNHGLAPAEIFSSLALFNGLRIPLNLLPLVLGQVVDAWSSLQRIQEFLLEEEMVEEMTIESNGEDAIRLENASFTWEKTPTNEPEKPAAGKGKKSKKEKDKKKPVAPPESDPASEDTASTLVEEREPFKLHDLSMSVKRNELIAVIGSVGSGKSSLLSALAGDMRKTEGEVVFGSSRAFCPQYAWIQNTTLQKNITFGKPLDKSWYKEVVRACALQADLDMLPNGDQTEIGERGITISGGQKQRLNIARAIYFDADIVLMDDPLSAVDAHVGRHIFDKAILGLLKDKCRILATHQLWVLNRCDRIVWMEGGKIQAIDTFDNLMREHRGFQALMETTAVEDRDEDASKPAEAKADDDSKDKKKKKKKSAALMQQEERATASVPWSVYTAYIGASGSILNAPLVIFVLLLSQGANIMTSLWLSYWTSDKYGLTTGVYIGIYAALGVAQAVLMFIFSVLLSILGTNSSKYMLQQAVKRVLRAPMAFFDTTPLGRITNRFSRDVDVMDNNLTDAIRMFFLTMAMITSVFILIIAYFYYFAIALVPLYILFVLAASYYRASAREVKRYESVLRSHVFAKFGEGLSGVASIRAYGLQDRFIEELRESIDDMNSAYYITFANQRWLSVRIDIIGVLLVFTVAILVVTSRFSINPSIGGLVLSYILAIVGMMQFSVRQLAEVENAMNAVERLYYYGTEIEEEAPEHTVEVRKSWPEKGEIIFDNVEMRYRANLPLVLQGLSMHVQGGERIGIVGRTGAGKSSIMSTLFRLVEISGGRITIDGLDISTIGLHDLRSRLAIIPQDPTLFRGTVRSNLDPFHEHTDLALWSALRQADLIPVDAGDSPAEARRQDPSRIHLDSVVEEDGLNFSLGQRQLMALARALVRGSQIIVCDEATSSVDMETDDKIQTTIATGFRGKTLLCIAHRLRTIIGYDRICVMDAGTIAELDTPLALWKQGGIFRSMCDRSGIRAEDIHGAREELAGLESGEGSRP